MGQYFSTPNYLQEDTGMFSKTADAVRQAAAEPLRMEDVRSQMGVRDAESQRRMAAEPLRLEDIRSQIAERGSRMQERSDPLYGMTGNMANAIRLQKAEQKFGADDPRVMQLRDMQNLEQERESTKQRLQEGYLDTLYKRSSTREGKSAQERNEINQGFLPGTSGSDNPIQLSPQQQNELRDQYDLNTLKNVTDQPTRQKVLMATNIEKTFDNIDVPTFTQYSGLLGGASKKFEELKTIFGAESEEYKQFQETMTNVDLLGSQIRQFYGDSVSKETQKHLKELTNPNSWLSNPDQSARKFEALKKTLDQEMGTFRDGLKTPTAYTGEQQSPVGFNANDVQGQQQMQSLVAAANNFNTGQAPITQEDLVATATKHGITIEEVVQRLSGGGQ